jgi:thiopurine S-methyltransferase
LLLLPLEALVRMNSGTGTSSVTGAAMEREFWLARWDKREIGFHLPEVNPWLKKCWPALGVTDGSTVFVPLCGKSLDLGWFAAQGHEVIGVELAEAAVRAFYRDACEPFRVERQRHMQCYSGGRVTLYCGDFMDMTALHLGGVAAVYDRAALVALPPKMRAQYADHLQRIIPEGCFILLLTMEYDQRRVAGPPHSVEEAEVRELFGARCDIERICAQPTSLLPPKFSELGLAEVTEVAYRLVKRS